ncbi:MAG: 2-phosphosulfolactate phosphatase [Bacteroidales bacterium]
MEIKILNLIEGAREATGLTVIIDVFRAFSLGCYVIANGADKIIAVGDIAEAYGIKEKHPEFILIGEREERMPAGFDFGNSPSHILNIDFTGKTIVHTTSSGTQGMVNAVNADEVITGSFVNAGAIIRYIQQKMPKSVSLVGMGYAGQYQVEEDAGCAQYIANELLGKGNDFEGMVNLIRKTSGKRFFFEENQHYAPKEDFDLCLNINRFNFVLQRNVENNKMVLRKIDICL